MVTIRLLSVVLAAIILQMNMTEISANCGRINGKTTCITESLLQMIMKNSIPSCQQEHKDKPAFLAFLSGHITFSKDQIYKFDDVRVNIGNHYNKETGIFTAPRKGLYHISCVITGSGNMKVHYTIYHNDKVFLHGFVGKFGNTNSQSHSFVINLNKGDKVSIRNRDPNQRLHGLSHMYFSGYFIQ